MDPFEHIRERNRQSTLDREASIAFFGESRTNKPKRIKSTVARPICAFCHKQYGNRNTKTERRTYAIGQPIEPYRGNHHLVCEEIMVGIGPDNGPGATVRRETWDGISYYSGHEPFCTATCAVSFANAAYRAGYRMVRCPT